jgi:hypothetical protein
METLVILENGNIHCVSYDSIESFHSYLEEQATRLFHKNKNNQNECPNDTIFAVDKTTFYYRSFFQNNEQRFEIPFKILTLSEFVRNHKGEMVDHNFFQWSMSN